MHAEGYSCPSEFPLSVTGNKRCWGRWKSDGGLGDSVVSLRFACTYQNIWIWTGTS